MLKRWVGSTLILSRMGTRSRRAAFLISVVLSDEATFGCSITGTTGVDGIGAGAGALMGVLMKLLISGIFMDSSGAIGSGGCGMAATCGSGG